MFISNHLRSAATCVALGFFAGGGSDAYAQSTWVGGGSNSLWSDSANWQSNVPPANNGTAAVAFGGSVRLTPTVDVPWSIASLAFQPGAGSFQLGGATLTIGAGGVSSTAASQQTISNAVDLSASQAWTSTLGNATLGGLLNLGGFTLTVNPSSGRTITLSSEVSGTGAMIKSGAGTLALSAANTFSGGMTLSGGTVLAGTNTAFGTGLLTLRSGTISAAAARIFSNAVDARNTIGFGGQAQTFTGPFTLTGNTTLNTAVSLLLSNGVTESGGARSLTKSGTGTLTISNTLGITGPLTLSAGQLVLNTDVALPGSNLVFNGGTLGTSGTINRTLGSGAGQVRFTGGGGFFARGGNLNVGVTAPSTPVWGTTPDFLPGTSTLTLNSSIATGVVDWTTGFSLGAADRTISVTDNTGSTADWAVISGTISGTGGLIKTGTGQLHLLADNSFTGPVRIRGGTVVIPRLSDVGNDSPLGRGASALELGLTTTVGTLRSTGTGGTTDRPISLTGTTGGGTVASDGSGPVIFTGGVSATNAGTKTLTLSGANTGSNQISGPISNGSGVIAIAKTGTGRWILSGNNSYSGNTTLSAGELSAGSNTAFGTGQLLLAGGVLSTAGSPVSLSNSFTISGSLTVAGTSPVTLTGAGAVTGNRTLTANTSLTLSGPTLILAEANQTRTLTITGTGAVEISSTIQNGTGTGDDRISKSGTGTLTLSGANTYTGQTTLSGGTLALGNNAALGTGLLSITAGTVTAHGGPRSIANALSLAGNATIGGSQALSWLGTTTLTGSRTLTVNNSATTTLAAVALSNSATNRSLTISGTGTTVISGPISNGGTSTAGALAKSGTGRLILTGPNTYGGVTTVSQGTLEIRNNTALGTGVGNTVVLSGAALALQGNISVSEAMSIAGTGVGATGAIVNISGSNTILATITQTAASSIRSEAGTLTMAPAAGSAISGAFALELGGSGRIEIQRGLSIGSAVLTKTGSGTAVLGFGGLNTTGDISVASGTLAIGGSTNSGTLTVAASAFLETRGGSVMGKSASIAGSHTLGATPGTATFQSGLAYTAGSTVSWALAANSDAGAGSNFDQIVVTGGNLSIAPSSLLRLVFDKAGSTVNWNDSFWSTNRQWTMLDFSGTGSSSGLFSSINITPDASGQTLASVRPDASFSVARLGNDITVTYAAVPEPSVLALSVVGLALMLWFRRRSGARSHV